MEDEKILGYVGDGNSVKGSHLGDDGSWELAVEVTDPDLWQRIKAAHAIGSDDLLDQADARLALTREGWQLPGTL